MTSIQASNGGERLLVEKSFAQIQKEMQTMDYRKIVLKEID